MLRSIRSAPRSAATAAAERMISGSWPNSWIATGPPARSSRVHDEQLVERLAVAVVDRVARDHLATREPGAVALGLQAHEPVADAGQRREHDPVGDRDPAEGPRVGATAAVKDRAGSRAGTVRVALVDEPQARERQQLVDVVDRLAERDDRARPGRRSRSPSVSSPSSSRRRPRMPSTCAGEAVDHAGADRLDRRLADQRPRRVEVDLRDRRRALVSASIEISTPGAMMPADVLARRADDVVGDRRAEVDDHARAAHALVGGDGVDEPVGADLARVVHPDRHARSAAPGRRPASRGRGSAPPSRSTPAAAAAPSRRGSTRRCPRTPGRAARAGCAAARRARPRSTPARSRSASRGRARRRGTRRGGSACCRRRRRGARPGLCSARDDRRALRHPGVASVRGRRARAPAQGRRLPARRADPAVHQRRQRRASARARCPASSSTTGSGSRLAPILRALEERVPSRRCCRRRRDAARASSAPRSGATRCSSRSRAASIWAAAPRDPAVDALHRGREAAGAAIGLARRSPPRLAARVNGAGDAIVRADLVRSGPPRPRRPLDRARRARRRRGP